MVLCGNKVWFVFSFILFSSYTYLFSQDTIESFLEQKLESLAEELKSEEVDYSTLLDAMNYYRKHPIDLNHTTKEELMQLSLLDEIQIEFLLEHIEKNGKLISIYELQSVDGFDLQTIRKIIPYIRVADNADQRQVPVRDMIRHGHHELISRVQQIVEPQKGFSPVDASVIASSPNSRYIGSPQKVYERYRFTYGNSLSAGITAEKDAGELFFKNNLKYSYSGKDDSIVKKKLHNGFDFYSAHLFVRSIGFVRALAVGDYQVGFGQGLTCYSGLAFGKSSDVMNIKKYAAGLRPFTSSNENSFMRGAAATVGNNSFQFTGFVSRKKVDANVILSDTLIEGEAMTVSSLLNTGLHATPAELAGKDALTQTVFGGNVSVKKKKYSIGATGVHTVFDALYRPSISTYNRFDFSGKQLSDVGADYSFVIRNFNFFGEASVSNNGGTAGVNGCIIALDRRLSFSVLHRYLQRNYQNLYSSVFSESSAPQSNEQGIYFGVAAKPFNSISINAYYDHFSFPWLKYRVNAPSDGNDALTQLEYVPNKKFETYIRFQQKNKFSNSILPSEINFLSPFRQTNYRWQASYQAFPSLKLQNRLEYVVLANSDKPKESGCLIYQDVIWKKMRSKFSVTLRYALFDTKSYDTRIYAMEENIPGAYSIPSYYYKGSRIFVMLNYDITRNIQFWLRWAQTYYANKNVLSAGTLSEIDGHTKTEVSMQLILKF
ncbi:MAG TPA: helix-hairpin-helix domain-containing protein [Bacteroidia bacterium]